MFLDQPRALHARLLNVASSGASFRLVLPSGLTAVAGLESESRPESA